MADSTVREILSFAIEREKEAAAFYRGLQEKAGFKSMKTMLFELEAMEMGHITVLEGLEKKELRDLEPKKVTDLKISEYLVTPEKPEAEMDYQDILILAMKREEASFRLYTNLASRVSGTDTEKLLLRIASEEAGHKLRFESLYDEHILKEN
ncbi:MAG: ferritin family protein [Spirochaetales bacterium]|nr:ferritin family protein [Spirochaetales bacterium]